MERVGIQNLSQKGQIPSFARREAYDFEATNETFEIYKELNAISEEIEQCRLKNC